MGAFIDARTLPQGTRIDADIGIVGGGPAGITLALSLADSGLRVALLEAGDNAFNRETQNLYQGTETAEGASGVRYVPLDVTRLRQFGGCSNHWGGWTRPLERIDFEKRAWMAWSGWPFLRSTLEAYYPRAQGLIETGEWIYDNGASRLTAVGAPLPLADGGVYTSWFQFSKTQGGILPTQFAERYAADLRRAPNIAVYTNANVTGIRMAHNAASVDGLDIATLNGVKATLKAGRFVLAAGAIETARLMLASNDVSAAGVGNINGLVGRFYADHPIPRDTATMVLFDGAIAPFYLGNQTVANRTILRATLSPTEAWRRKAQCLGALITVENKVALDETGTDAVVAASQALGVDASNAGAWSLGCGIEMTPDPERRITLTGARDALGLPRANLNMTLPDNDLAQYRRTLAELGRQLMAARIGMLRLNLSARGEWLARLDWGNHHMGTARMHADPKQGVTDAEGKVHGVGNLYVAGSSTFPTYGASNPTLNLVALALRLGDHLRGSAL